MKLKKKPEDEVVEGKKEVPEDSGGAYEVALNMHIEKLQKLYDKRANLQADISSMELAIELLQKRVIEEG